MTTFMQRTAATFDQLEEVWESRATRHTLSAILIVSFFGALVLIELSRQGMLAGMPDPLNRIPTNHFYAIDVAFTLFLVFELASLVFGLATSVSDALGKQFEVFSLIMLRQSFKELIYFNEEPITWGLDSPASREAVQLVIADATSALLIFVAVGFFYQLQRRQRITTSSVELRQFIAAKKLVSLVLLVVFVGMGGVALYDVVAAENGFKFFDAFYTVLIFSDVLIVLLSLRFSSTFHIVFRNSGFAAATVMIRLALAGPRYFDGLIGVGAAIYAIGLVAAYNHFAPVLEAAEPEENEADVPPEPDADKDAVQTPTV
jgi:phosphate starvation-inducible membrane PsiE